MSSEVELIAETLDRVQAGLEELIVRGLRSSGPAELSSLAVLADELGQVGAAELARRLTSLLEAIRADDPRAASALLATQASVRVFERVLTLETAAELLAPFAGEDEDA